MYSSSILLVEYSGIPTKYISLSKRTPCKFKKRGKTIIKSQQKEKIFKRAYYKCKSKILKLQSQDVRRWGRRW